MTTTAPSEKTSSLPTAMLVVWWTVTIGWSALAFGKLNNAPEWLSRAQAVCFGTLPNGLPDTYGWVALTLGPLSILGGLIAIYRRDLILHVKAMKQTFVGFLAIAAFVAVSLMHVSWIGLRINDGVRIAKAARELPSELSETLPEEYPRLNKPATDFNLVDQAGNKVSLERLRGKTTLLTFAFAHCQTICPMIVKRAQQASQKLAGQEVETLIVTLDPWRDTPNALPTIAKGWELGAGQRVLSGEVAEVNRVLDAYNVARNRDEKTGNIDHPALIYVIDPQGMLAYAFNNPKPEWLAQAVRNVKQDRPAASLAAGN